MKETALFQPKPYYRIFNPSGSFSLLFPPARTALWSLLPQNLHEKITGKVRFRVPDYRPFHK
jgi:hypothetical protein